MILVEGYELAQTITLPKGNVGKGQDSKDCVIWPTERSRL
jgi:hypothetical protein